MTVQSKYIEEFSSIFQRIVNLRRRFKAVVPGNLALLRDRIESTRLEGKASDVDNFNQYYSVCLAIQQNPEAITMGELSQILDTPFSNTTRIVDWLVRNEYAVRLPDAEDRRVVRVELTSDGVELFETINQFIMERVSRTIGEFTPEEQAQMIHLLNKLLAILERDL